MARTVIEVGEVIYGDAEIPQTTTRIPAGPNPHLSTVEFLAKNRDKAKEFILPINPKAPDETASLDRTANLILGAHCRKLDEAGAVHGVTVKKDVSRHLDAKGRQDGVRVVFWAVDKREYKRKDKAAAAPEAAEKTEAKVPAQAGAQE